jgi:hypothetical protein
VNAVGKFVVIVGYVGDCVVADVIYITFPVCTCGVAGDQTGETLILFIASIRDIASKLRLIIYLLMNIKL